LRKLSTSIDLRNTSKFYHSVAPNHCLTENKTSAFFKGARSAKAQKVSDA